MVMKWSKTIRNVQIIVNLFISYGKKFLLRHFFGQVLNRKTQVLSEHDF
jgi:hypothetical protein